MDKLIKALKEGVVTVVFEKIDTKEIRSMACTLNSEVANLSTSITNQSPDCSTIVMFALRFLEQFKDPLILMLLVRLTVNFLLVFTTKNVVLHTSS